MIIFFALMAYLIGSLSSAIIICKLLHLPDPRTHGSGNPGTTNVLRIGSKSAAIATLIGDVLKGVIPVLIAEWYGLSSFGLSLVIFAAFLGHLFPVYFRFQGGKGVATAFGCIITLAWPVGLSLVGTWLIIAVVFRYSSLAALVAAALSPLYTWYFTQQFDYTSTVLLISILLIYRHRKNIKNLLAGTESKIGQKKITTR
jgi:glycerol-3-phosphate acyltransferase PlsY